MAAANAAAATRSPSRPQEEAGAAVQPPRNPVLVDVPELGYLMIDGRGAVDDWAGHPTHDLQRAFAALYGLMYTIKFALKPAGVIVPVLPLERFWVIGENGAFDLDVPKEEWGWCVLMAVSDEVTPGVFDNGVAEVRRKKGTHPKRSIGCARALARRALRPGHARRAVTAKSAPTIEGLHAFIAEQGLRPRGAHHEDLPGRPAPRRPANLKTVLRQPVE